MPPEPHETTRPRRDSSVIQLTTSIRHSQATKLPIDYLAIGPIFQTTTKTTPPLSSVWRACAPFAARLASFPSSQSAVSRTRTLATVIEAGADSVAVISALLSDPGRITEMTQNLFQSLPSHDKHNFLAFVIVMRENRPGFGGEKPFERPTCQRLMHNNPCGVRT
jgi:hypothetical protein